MMWRSMVMSLLMSMASSFSREKIDGNNSRFISKAVAKYRNFVDEIQPNFSL
jgi:hypothetical protein